MAGEPAWREFKLIDLFEVSGCRRRLKSDLELKPDGLYPYITTQRTDNGVYGYSDTWTEAGGCLTVDSAVLGTVFYQEENFTASPHVEKLVPKFKMTGRVALFMQTVLDQAGRELGYSYQKKRSQAALRKETVFLPCRADGSVDFNYMEEYIRGMEEECFQAVHSFMDEQYKAP